METEQLAYRRTGEDQQVDPMADSEHSIYDDDEKQLVVPSIFFTSRDKRNSLPS
jgi:hypothetical protein